MRDPAAGGHCVCRRQVGPNRGNNRGRQTHPCSYLVGLPREEPYDDGHPIPPPGGIPSHYEPEDGVSGAPSWRVHLPGPSEAPGVPPEQSPRPVDPWATKLSLTAHPCMGSNLFLPPPAYGGTHSPPSWSSNVAREILSVPLSPRFPSIWLKLTQSENGLSGLRKSKIVSRK
ncbi:hypothetical protein DFH07DRAFT_974988 [Mycena maculata]|uniref:Uncharacterized protein n=1 Tax=Mycena maculata TaxID=230809 RepID=A0AAD7MDT9_9AGAR|nr:hypothetical protein DFH07DRAFT_974988 [Mycena maculata]